MTVVGAVSWNRPENEYGSVQLFSWTFGCGFGHVMPTVPACAGIAWLAHAGSDAAAPTSPASRRKRRRVVESSSIGQVAATTERRRCSPYRPVSRQSSVRGYPARAEVRVARHGAASVAGPTLEQTMPAADRVRQLMPELRRDLESLVRIRACPRPGS